jgi:hypothetical protein
VVAAVRVVQVLEMVVRVVWVLQYLAILGHNGLLAGLLPQAVDLRFTVLQLQGR